MTHCSMQPLPVRRRIFFNELFARGCVFNRHGSGSLATWAAIRGFTAGMLGVVVVRRAASFVRAALYARPSGMLPVRTFADCRHAPARTRPQVSVVSKQPRSSL